MTNEQSDNVSMIKPYQIILISCLLGSILVANSNYVNKNRELARLNKQKGELFDTIIQRRKLQSQNYSEEVCSRASDDLNEYYNTGDLSKIDIDGIEAIECKNKDSKYMKALISIVRSVSDNDEDSNNVDDDTHSNGPNGYTLRNLDELNTDDILDYAMDRILPMSVFLTFGILGFIGWIVCCFCCCCNCCCCCCCKKKTCKLPCFVFTYIFYALVIVVCIYGLTQTNKIFVGLANTECSFLKFFDQVVDGEMKQDLPRWAGINSIQGLLTNINNTLKDLSENSYENLTHHMDEITASREDFTNKMHKVGDNFYDGTRYKDPYVKSYVGTSSYPLSGKYVYDIVYSFGRYDNDQKKYTEPSSIYAWDQEFSIIDREAYDYLTTAHDGFEDILNKNLGDVQNALGEGKDSLDELLDPFNDIKDDAGEALYDVSDSIDHYGKMGVNAVFGALMGMNISLAVLMLLIALFSGKSCTSCCCCRCLFKFCTHILWNVLALLMILSFIIGSLVALVGRLGGDMMGILSYVMSIDNFNGTNPILVNELDSAKDYIYTCLHGDGDIAKQLNLGDSLDSFDDINNVESNITEVLNNFTSIMNMTPVYNGIKTRLDDQFNLKEDITMISKDGNTPISYNYLITKINEKVSDKGIRWDTANSNNYGCSSSITSYYPKSCKPKDSLSCNTNTDCKNYADILDSIYNIVDYAHDPNKDEDSGTGKAASVMKVINDLKGEYINYLQGYVNILNFFLETIHKITDLIRQYSGNGNAFSFLNGKFIGTNLKIILKYLEHSLGKDFYTVGICLCIVGLSLILSISSTILLIVIINIELEEYQKQEKNQNNANTGLAVSEYTANHPVQKAY